MNRYFVGVDLGATSGRVILATLCGDGIALEVLHRFPNRLLSIGGKYYWNIYSLYEEILHGLTLAGQRRLRVDSIGIDTWGVDMACVAADGTLAGLPRAYRDPYTNGVPEEFFRKIPRQEGYPDHEFLFALPAPCRTRGGDVGAGKCRVGAFHA